MGPGAVVAELGGDYPEPTIEMPPAAGKPTHNKTQTVPFSRRDKSED